MVAAVLAGLAFLLCPAHRTDAQTAPTMTSLKLPVPAGTAWKVLQGYNGGTHTAGPEFYALDLVRDGGATGGTDVVAPASGSLWFAHAPGAGNGCVSIKVDGGGGGAVGVLGAEGPAEAPGGTAVEAKPLVEVSVPAQLAPGQAN